MGRPRKTPLSNNVNVDVNRPEVTQALDKHTIVHIVQRGESIQSIANRYGISVRSIIALSGSETVSVGQILYIN